MGFVSLTTRTFQSEIVGNSEGTRSMANPRSSLTCAAGGRSEKGKMDFSHSGKGKSAFRFTNKAQARASRTPLGEVAPM